VADVFQINVTWKIIVIGLSNNIIVNQVVSLIAYIIYKKFQQEKAHINGYQNLSQFVTDELCQRVTVYQECKGKNQVIIILNDI
jgi:hypothetical protein